MARTDDSLTCVFLRVHRNQVLGTPTSARPRSTRWRCSCRSSRRPGARSPRASRARSTSSSRARGAPDASLASCAPPSTADCLCAPSHRTHFSLRREPPAACPRPARRREPSYIMVNESRTRAAAAGIVNGIAGASGRIGSRDLRSCRPTVRRLRIGCLRSPPRIASDPGCGARSTTSTAWQAAARRAAARRSTAR